MDKCYLGLFWNYEKKEIEKWSEKKKNRTTLVIQKLKVNINGYK